MRLAWAAASVVCLAASTASASEPVPAGYRVEERVRSGLIVGGAITFGASYGTSLLFAGSTNQNAPLYIPVVGPFILAGTIKGDTTGMGSAISVILGVVQVTGVALFAVGFIPKRELVRTDAAHVHLVPIVAPGHSGLAFVGIF